LPYIDPIKKAENRKKHHKIKYQHDLDMMRLYRELNKDKIAKNKKEWYENHKEYAKQKSREWNINNKDKVRDYNLMKSYGISSEQYNQMMVQQDSKCAICGIHSDQQSKKFCVDHSHATGKIRSLLCHHCNAGLGMFKESEVVIINAAKYLEKWR
jgi:hypothetical protein